MSSLSQIRETFIKYFERQGHKIVSSSSLVPHNDPTLMFTNAGMVQFKDVFTGHENRDYRRAVSSQKCVRAGGKHNDLDNVGYTARHHTFFEMLGNFSFGDYFKEQAIYYAWELLTKDFALAKDKMCVTVFHDDEEAFKIWKKISGYSDDKIIRIKSNDNFWSMGDTGPCGPCSEIFYDHGEHIAGGPPGSPEQDGDRFVEIWNLVFMQYETLASGERRSLPSPSIDTGMGLERMAALMQGVHNNYDIDLFKALINRTKELTCVNGAKHEASYRVIADHLRSASFLLSDGVMPSNEGRGYVLRRIMRRAMRHIQQLGCTEPLMYRLVPALIEQMGEVYPELVRAKSLITEILKLEEENFSTTLDRGLKWLEKETSGLSGGDELSGDTVFKLYDTYGFPYDLTADILRNRNITIDEVGFNAAMAEQKQRARAAWKGSGESATNELWYKIQEDYGATEFVGYDALEVHAKVVAIIKDNNLVLNADCGDKVNIILNQTPFYATSGGQEGDRGLLLADKVKIDINATEKYLNKIHAHVGIVKSGTIKVGDVVTAKIDNLRRNKLKANHSATHILHAVLREILGDHVTQKGSLVAEDKLRFDISYPKAITEEEKIRVESRVNEIIRQNSPVTTHIMTQENAIKSGAMALFGEKYADEVRVLSMGIKDNNLAYSIELCGGTHVEYTGNIGLFRIISEAAIASGVRRIEALTGSAALEFSQAATKYLTNISLQLKVLPEQIEEKIEALNQDRKQLEQELSKTRKANAMNASGSEEEIKGIKFVGQVFADIPAGDLRELALEWQKKLGSGVIALGSTFGGKASVVIAISSDLTQKFNAANMIRNIAPILGASGGGGKDNFAQTGGSNIANIIEAIDNARGFILTSDCTKDRKPS